MAVPFMSVIMVVADCFDYEVHEQEKEAHSRAGYVMSARRALPTHYDSD